jgi:hypothetical protein
MWESEKSIFCAFVVEFLTKKKVIFFVLRAKVKKKIRNWKKVPFYQFPHKAWEGVTMMHLVTNWIKWKLLHLFFIFLNMAAKRYSFSSKNEITVEFISDNDRNFLQKITFFFKPIFFSKRKIQRNFFRKSNNHFR